MTGEKRNRPKYSSIGASLTGWKYVRIMQMKREKLSRPKYSSVTAGFSSQKHIRIMRVTGANQSILPSMPASLIKSM